MVPVLAFGFEDNLKRMRVQEQAKAALQERLEASLTIQGIEITS